MRQVIEASSPASGKVRTFEYATRVCQIRLAYTKNEPGAHIIITNKQANKQAKTRKRKVALHLLHLPEFEGLYGRLIFSFRTRAK